MTQLTLAAGNALNQFYVEPTEDFITGVGDGDIIRIGPFEVQRADARNFVELNFLLDITTVDPLPAGVNGATVVILRNNDSTNPIFTNVFYFVTDSQAINIDLTVLDTSPSTGTPIGGPTEYSFLVTPFFAGVITVDYSLFSLSFQEMANLQELPLTFAQLN